MFRFAVLSNDFAALLGELPKLRVVIEHLGTRNLPHTDAAHHALQARVLELARFPNVYLKVHVLGQFCEKAGPPFGPFPCVRPIPPLLRLAYEAFGPIRLLWGSDCPLVAVREGYGNALRLTMAEVATINTAAVRPIFGDTARTLSWSSAKRE